jgi:hypothetical protein
VKVRVLSWAPFRRPNASTLVQNIRKINLLVPDDRPAPSDGVGLRPTLSLVSLLVSLDTNASRYQHATERFGDQAR